LTVEDGLWIPQDTNTGHLQMLWDGLERFGTALGRHLGRGKMQATQCLQALGRWDGLDRGRMGIPPC